MTKPPMAPDAGKPVPNGLHSRLAANLKEARRAAAMTQAQLSVVVGLSRDYVSQIEASHRSPTLEVVTRPDRDNVMPQTSTGRTSKKRAFDRRAAQLGITLTRMRVTAREQGAL